MRAGTTIMKAAQAFRRDRRGNFGMMMAIVTPLLALSAGYGLNIAQMTIVRSNLLAALDSAVTSTARDLTTGVIAEKDARGMVEAFLLANGGRAFADADRITLDSLVIDKARGTVSAEASIILDVAFPLFGAANRQTITAQSASLYSDKKIEIAMMLDVTDSMGGQKIKDLKVAAKNAVDALTKGQNQTNPRVRIALVPYSDGVNVGALAKDVVFVERKGGSDLPPPMDAKKAEIDANTGKQDNNCATERKDVNLKADFSDDAPDAVRERKDGQRYLAKVNRDDRLNSCAKAVLKPLSPDATALKKQIDDFSVAGYTAGAIGVQWTYYMLSQKWRPAIQKAGLGDGPADADPKEVAKIAILMTDGAFNTAHADVAGDEKAVRRQDSKSRSYAESLCDRMKADGIEVFTIGFKLDSNNARNVMKNCASADTGSLKHYYETSSGEELNDAFMTIARNVERLALTQ
ncbi:TadE/TadG family type IV pilus assembly protein [Mesorhizobium sp. CAU 1732]|uniref:TadE/TadG family type IV pilus assembly protein n=1 Tax=Mesorhizobium sp. CAU 1732 TaxID=3140358 RepID=UPI00326176E1